VRTVNAAVTMADPAAEYRALRAEIDAAVQRVLASGRYVLGPEMEALERELAAMTASAHAVAVNSGTDALLLALVAAGIGEGDEVIVPAFTFFATAEAVTHARATPVFADIDDRTFNIDVGDVARRLTPRTRAVIAVHLFGQCADMAALDALCRDRGVIVIEDCAQALGADYDGRKACAWGAFGCLSFYPTKNLAAAGDAGMVLCADAQHARTLRMLRHHGSERTYEHRCVGYNSRLDELQAAVLRVKLAHLAAFDALRLRNANRYRERLARTDVMLPVEHGRGRHVYHQFTIRSPRRDAIREALAAQGIATGVFYPRPVHRQPAYRDAYADVVLPVAERACAQVLSLPVHPFVDEAPIDRICETIAACG
jgi:dTDP-4-amino-4,6-dideoxygalactose transaminase